MSDVLKNKTLSVISARMQSVVLSCLAMVVFSGCARVEPPSRGRADVTDHRRIFFSQADKEYLRESTAILEENLSRDQAGLLNVTIPIRSAVPRSLYLEYNYEFYDHTGRAIESPKSWQPVVLEAGSPNTIQFTSVSPQAADYRVNIRLQR
jgi:uncharacterized protein YcfL